MALVGIQTDKRNPDYTIDDFCLWIPSLEKFIKTEKGLKYFNKLYPIANDKIASSIFGAEWEYAISLCIAHYIALLASDAKRANVSGDSLSSLAGFATPDGVLSGMSVGGFSKSYDFSLTTLTSEESLFWNNTPYGQKLYSLYKTKCVPSVFVVTQGNPLCPPRNRIRGKIKW